MAKKPKEPHTSVKNKGDSTSASASSSIFDTLFGDIREQGTSVSIFSDANPFRRKPADQVPQQQEQQHQLGSGFGSLDGSPQNVDSQNPNAGETSKGKRKKEKIPDSDSDPELGSVPKEKSSKRKEKKGMLGFESKEILDEDSSKSPKFDVRSNELSGKDEETNDIQGMELNGLVGLEYERKGKEKVKKKKRKRDEVEAEYEKKRYGLKDDIEGGGLGVGAVGEKRKKPDSQLDMLVSKEGFDDEDKLLRTVFVGNLPLKLKKKALLKEFSQFGEIESVRIRSIPLLDDKTPRKGAIMKKQINDAVDRVNAYIVFKMEESAQASLSYNMTVVGGNHIHVDRACPPRKKLRGENAPLYDSKRTVFVGNLPFDVKDEEIYQLFSCINYLKSSIEAVRVIRDPGTSMGKGIAYVLFKTRDAANVVVRKHNLKIRDRELRLYHATPNSTPSKRKDSLAADKYRSPAKKLAVGTTTPDSNDKVKSNGSISYQGMRASKSGVQKKAPRKISETVKSESMTQKVPKRKDRTSKRPAVAARKAAANAPKGGGGLTQAGGGLIRAGKKRKPESRTPRSIGRNKKARKFR